MVMCYPSTPRKLAATLGLFFGGAAMMVIGAHYSYKNVEPQRARTIARDNFVKEHLTKKYGYDFTIPYGQERRRKT